MLPMRIVQRKFSGCSRWRCSTTALGFPRLADAPGQFKASTPASSRKKRRGEHQADADHDRYEEGMLPIIVSPFPRGVAARAVRPTRPLSFKPRKSPILPAQGTLSFSDTSRRPWYLTPDTSQRRILAAEIVQPTRRTVHPPVSRPEFPHDKPFGLRLAANLPDQLLRISSIVTMPAVPPNSSSTIASPRCCRCRLLSR